MHLPVSLSTGPKFRHSSESDTVVVVGDVGRWQRLAMLPSGCEGVAFLAADKDLATALSSMSPELVISPVMGSDFDAVDLALVLQGIRFSGIYRAVAEYLPHPDIIRHEVFRAAPYVDFDVMTLTQMAKLARTSRLESA